MIEFIIDSENHRSLNSLKVYSNLFKNEEYFKIDDFVIYLKRYIRDISKLENIRLFLGSNRSVYIKIENDNVIYSFVSLKKPELVGEDVGTRKNERAFKNIVGFENIKEMVENFRSYTDQIIKMR